MSDMSEVVKGLLPINCFYNFRQEPDGKCYSTECMLNANAEVSHDIAKNGCKVFENHPDVIALRKEGRKSGD